MIDHDNLEEFADPHNYDIEDNSDTGVAFYTALAQETGGPVLEIACGTGRVSIPIARLGFAVTGLDIVPGMLEQARSKSAGLPTRWVEGDARTFDLGEQFRLIFLTGNAFQAFLTRADQEALLERVRAHLHDEGLFAFETRNPRWANLRRTLRTRIGRPATAGLFGLFANLETRAEEEELADLHRQQRTRGAGIEDAGYTTMSPRSCTGRPTGAGARAIRSKPRSRASRCASPSRRSLRRCCTTMASPSSASTAIGILSR